MGDMYKGVPNPYYPNQPGRSQVDSQRDQRLVDVTRGWDDALVGVTALGAGAGSPALEVVNSSVFRGYAMSGGVLDQSLYAQTQLTHGVTRGSEIRFHIHYVIEGSPASTAVNTVQWNLTYATLNKSRELVSSAMNNTQTTLQTIPVGTPAYTYGIIGLVTIVDTDIRESSLFAVQITRKRAGETSDTYDNNKIWILSADGHIFKEKAGTSIAIPTYRE